MKVAILSIMNIKHISASSIYTSIFDKVGIKWDIIYIDKYNIHEKTNANNVFRYCSYGKTKSLFGKLLYGLKFKKYAIDVLEKNKYDFIIVWREETAALFASYLKKKYKNRYTVDIRDLWSQRNFFLTLKIKKALKYSAINTIASDGFLKYLPKKYKYRFVNGISDDFIRMFDSFERKQRKSGIIKIKSVGTFRNENYYYDLVKALGNDNRFEISFIGQGSEKMKLFAEKNGFNNVKCYGSFETSETVRFYQDADIVNCSSGYDDKAEISKIPIRFYYGLFCGVPILTNKGTHISNIGNEIGIAISIDYEDFDNLGDVILKKYNSVKVNKSRIDKYKKDLIKSKLDFEKIVLEMMNCD